MSVKVVKMRHDENVPVFLGVKEQNWLAFAQFKVISKGFHSLFRVSSVQQIFVA